MGTEKERIRILDLPEEEDCFLRREVERGSIGVLENEMLDAMDEEGKIPFSPKKYMGMAVKAAMAAPKLLGRSVDTMTEEEIEKSLGLEYLRINASLLEVLKEQIEGRELSPETTIRAIQTVTQVGRLFNGKSTSNVSTKSELLFRSLTEEEGGKE